MSKNGRDKRALALFAVLLMLVAIAFSVSPDYSIGLAQARQVVMPLGLVFAGFVLRHEIPWRSVQKTIIFFSLVAIIWVYAEEVKQAPLLDPVWYYLDGLGASETSLRSGLPPAYYADGVGGKTVFRPGGPFMNAPVLGFLLGLGAYAGVARLSGISRLIFLALTALALYIAYARAGLLIFAIVTIIYFIWLKVGRFAGILVAVGLGAFMTLTFLDQGNTASHSDGLLSGFLTGITHPLGLGFGTTGYQAALESGSAGVGSESLLGLYFAWLGWPMIAGVLFFVAALVVRLRVLSRKASLPVWCAVAFLLAAASSESASSISSTPLLWLLCGSVLALAAKPLPAVQTQDCGRQVARQTPIGA